jgi:two-component system response regulator YesN
MKMSWYYRILLSYAPIFFVVISVLIFAFFAVLNNSAKDQIALTDEAIATKVMQAVDTNLRAAERMVIKEIYMNEALGDFFNDNRDKTISDYFLISRKLDDFSSVLPFANSIYLYNEKLGKVLSRSGLSSLDEFGDRAFLMNGYRSGSNTTGWTNPRGFKEFIHEAGEERVITLYKNYPVLGEKQGAMVVNIRVSALVGFVKDLTRYDAGLVQLFAANQEPFDRNSRPWIQYSGTSGPEIIPLHTVSDYTGWSYLSGKPSTEQLSLLSVFHDFWILVGLATIVAGLVWFTYVTHRNYKPIQAIAGRIQDYSKRRSGELVRHTAKDELKFIEAAIDGLLERSSQYEEQYKDDLVIRKRQRLAEWLEGSTEMNEGQWKQEMAKLQLPVAYERLTAAVMEIDRVTHFVRHYSTRDQYLLKFVVSNVLQEIAQTNRIILWNEWLEPHQMAVVFFIHDQENQDYLHNKVHEAMDQLQAWVRANLEFTVSVGVGTGTTTHEGIARSYEEAKEHLGCKPVFGINCTIGRGDVRPKEEGGIFPHLPKLSTLAKSFRLDDGKWSTHLNQLVQVLHMSQVSQADMVQLMDCLLYHFYKETLDMSDEVQKLWKQDYLPKLDLIMDESESLDGWHERLRSLLAGFEAQIQAARTVRNHYSLMCRVKQYIEMYYADPDLSLNKISEHFDMNSRYLSKLFKDEFGEKFIDYMLKVRLEEARRLLLETDLPVSEIAERVGYLHVISFHRAFKNLFGLPPGDYRKRKDAAKLLSENDKT